MKAVAPAALQGKMSHMLMPDLAVFFLHAGGIDDSPVILIVASALAGIVIFVLARKPGP